MQLKECKFSYITWVASSVTGNVFQSWKNGVEAQNETEVAGQKESKGMPPLLWLVNFMSSGRNDHGARVQNHVF